MKRIVFSLKFSNIFDKTVVNFHKKLNNSSVILYKGYITWGYFYVVSYLLPGTFSLCWCDRIFTEMRISEMTLLLMLWTEWRSRVLRPTLQLASRGKQDSCTIVPSPLGDWPCASDCPVIPNISQMPQTCQAFWLSLTHRYCKNKITLHSSELIIQRRLYSLLIQRWKTSVIKTSTKNQAGVAEIFGGHIKQETSDRQTDKHIGVGIELLRN